MSVVTALLNNGALILLLLIQMTPEFIKLPSTAAIS